MKKHMLRIILLGVVLSAFYFLIISPLYHITPEIGRGLPANLREAQETFSKRVTTRFPLGSSTTNAKSILKQQGFEIREPINLIVDDTEGSANNVTVSFKKSGFPCDYVWRIIIEDKEGKITNISAVYGGICL